MKSDPPSQPGMLLWQDLRARAIDQNLDVDRRSVGERVAELFRWLFLIVFVILVDFGGLAEGGAVPIINAFLAVWAVLNLAITVTLARGYRPGRRFSLAVLAVDLGLGAAMLFFSGQVTNPYLVAYFLTTIAGSTRSGTAAGLAAALSTAVIYLFVGGAFSLSEAAGRIFLFVAAALATALMSRELERERRIAIARAAQADALREMSVNMASSLDIKDVFEVVLQHAVRMTAAEHGSLLIALDDTIHVAAQLDAANGEVHDLVSEQADACEVARRGEAAFGADRLSLVVPVASGDGVTAVLSLYSRGRPLSNEDLFMINALAGSAAVPLANALHYERSAQDAITDGLTGLFNHREFRRQLESEFARRQHRSGPLSVMLIDLDGFKSVNDSMGHQHGDEVIKTAARLVRATARAHDLVARYGGDELAVIAVEAGAAGVSALAERLIQSVHEARIVTSPGQHLTLSIGIATYPEDALYLEELIMAADQALYLAKRDGRDRARTCAGLVERFSNQQVLIEGLVEAGPQVVVATAHALDGRRPGMRGHSSRVAAVAEAIGRRAGYPHSQVEKLRMAAFLHDLGTLTTDQDGPAHAEQGERLAIKGSFPAEVCMAIRHQHERWDGNGYPDRLAGEGIPLEARIVALADHFEEATAGRKSRRLLSVSEALELIGPEAGAAFDPQLVDALRALAKEGDLALRPEPYLPGGALVPPRAGAAAPR